MARDYRGVSHGGLRCSNEELREMLDTAREQLAEPSRRDPLLANYGGEGRPTDRIRGGALRLPVNYSGVASAATLFHLLSLAADRFDEDYSGFLTSARAYVRGEVARVALLHGDEVVP